MQEKSFINSQLGIKFKSYIDEQCNVWFKAKDVAKILGYCDTKKAIKQHVSVENKIIKLINSNVGGYETPPQQKDTRGKYCMLVNEPGFYELVFKSRLPTAKIFRQWVFAKVLPSIRKYGYYKMIDSKRKQRVIFDKKKYYKHPVFSNYAANENGDVLSLKSEKILKMTKNNSGYLYFKIYDKKLGKPKDYLQHRFVYEVFQGPIPSCFEVDHLNNFRSDNRIKNLQLLTPQKNSEKSNNKPIISINIDNGKKEDLFLLKKLRLNWILVLIVFQRFVEKYVKQRNKKKNGMKYTFKFID